MTLPTPPPVRDTSRPNLKDSLQVATAALVETAMLCHALTQQSETARLSPQSRSPAPVLAAELRRPILGCSELNKTGTKEMSTAFSLNKYKGKTE